MHSNCNGNDDLSSKIALLLLHLFRLRPTVEYVVIIPI